MELVDMDQHFETIGKSRAAGASLPRRCLELVRRYALALCLAEGAVLVLLVCHLMYAGNQDSANQQQQQLQPYQPAVQPQFQPIQEQTAVIGSTKWMKTFVTADNRSITLDLSGAPTGCTQRAHDFSHGSVCISSAPEQCSQQLRESSPEALGMFRLVRTDEVLVITTSKAGQRLHAVRQPLSMNNLECSGKCRFKTRLELEPQTRHQEIIGWGGALTDSAINNILSLSSNGTKQLLQDYYGQDGLGYTITRVTIGGSDFSASFYTNNDLGDSSRRQTDDFAMSNFSLQVEDTLYKIPILKRVRELVEAGGRPPLFMASMWSPPVWMKTNEHFNKGMLKGSRPVAPVNGVPAIKEKRYFTALAELKRRWLTAYNTEGVKFWGLTVMNEPFFASSPFLNFNTMIFPKHDYAEYVANFLGPMLKNSPALKRTKLMVHDDNRRFLDSHTTSILDNEAVRKYISGVATHGYTDEDYHLMQRVYQRYSGPDGQLFVLPDELCSGHLPWMEKALIGNWHRGIHYALDIIRGLQHSAAGWVDWNMALDMQGGPGWLGGRLDSPVIVDKTADTYYRSPMFYVLGQFSRYIPAGSLRVASAIYNDNYDHHFETVTFAHPNGKNLVTVVLNNNPHEVELLLTRSGKPRGSETYNRFSVVCAADSVTTIVYAVNILH